MIDWKVGEGWRGKGEGLGVSKDGMLVVMEVV